MSKRPSVALALKQRCTVCDHLKTRDHYTSAGWLCATCRTCLQDLQHASAVEGHRARLLHRYRLTPADYEHMAAAQGGKCTICQETPIGVGMRRLYIDHDHATGQVRGLLCNRCNTALGLLRDSPVLLQRAIQYLQGAPLPSM